jgi:quinol monooxygenase YgiN
MGASMMTITAIIRAKEGDEATMRRVLLHVADHVRINEPSTVGFFVSQDASDPRVFTTYERFADQAAMDRHNASDAVARFFEIAKPDPRWRCHAHHRRGNFREVKRAASSATRRGPCAGRRLIRIRSFESFRRKTRTPILARFD